MTRNKAKATVTRAKAQTSKPTSTKKTSSKKPPTKKGPSKKNASQKNPTKKYSTRKITKESQVERLEAAWQKANNIWKGTGGGAFDTAFALKEQEKWSNESPKWLCEKKVALGPMLKKCNIVIESKDNSDYTFEDILPTEAEVNHNPLEHSPHLNVAYKGEEEDPKHRSLDNTFQSDLAHQVDNIGDESDTMMDNLRTMFDNEGDHIRSLSPPVILTQLQASNSSATPLKHTGSKNSLNSLFDSLSQKQTKTAAGSASKVHNLLQTHNLSNRFGLVTSRKDIKDKDVEIISKRDEKINWLLILADNLVSSMFVQKEKSVLDGDQEKQKAKMEMAMAEVQLAGEKKKLSLNDFNLNAKRDHHQLDLQTKQAELKHQQTARNAQLIGKLMKENGLSLQEAMSAVQCATGMSAKDPTK
ncbi:hypothetical protein DFH28DRAFT_1220302 [Melampsora americana]|nr:hypothetical protein DFH28DRAFT_1220302 [Melampsora americana]